MVKKSTCLGTVVVLVVAGVFGFVAYTFYQEYQEHRRAPDRVTEQTRLVEG